MHVILTVALSVALIVLTGYVLFLRQQKQFTGNVGSRETSPAKGTPGGSILVTGFFTPVGKLAGSASPFTNKIETYLRFAGLRFEVQDGGFAGSPKGRVRPACRATRLSSSLSNSCFKCQAAASEIIYCAAAMDETWQRRGGRLTFYH